MTNPIISTAQKQAELLREAYAQAMPDSELIATLQSLGQQVTPESIAEAREITDALTSMGAKSFQKELGKQLEKLENKARAAGGSLDLSAALPQAIERAGTKTASQERCLKRAAKLMGSCEQCHVSNLDLAKQDKTLEKCGRCRVAMFCSKECQTSNWPTHKKVCGWLADAHKQATDNAAKVFVDKMRATYQSVYSKEQMAESSRRLGFPTDPASLEKEAARIKKVVDSAIDQVIGSFKEELSDKIAEEAAKRKITKSKPNPREILDISISFAPEIAFAHSERVQSLVAQALRDAYPKASEALTPQEALILKKNLEGRCAHCEKTAADLEKFGATLQKCARCVAAMYCSKECQTSDWPTHKGVCKLLKAAQDSAAHQGPNA